MKEQYLIEITQKQLIFVSVEAESSSHAIDLAMSLQGEITRPYPPEIEQITARIINERHERI